MKILVVSVHPDDETLGAGGTLLKYKNDGHSINWLNITNVSKEYGYKAELVNKKNDQINRVCKSYGIENFYNLSLEPAFLDKYYLGDIIAKISDVIKELEPELVLIPNETDIHSDHQISFKAIIAATKSFRYPFIKKILAMEVVSETDFDINNFYVPNYYVDITPYMEQKLEIASIYEQEMQEHPFPRSLENLRALGIRRGSQANVKYAESFKVLKIIE